MGAVWFVIGILILVVAVGGTALYLYLRKQRASAERSQRFKIAVLAQENRRDAALMKDKNSPDAYIAEREILKIKQRYISGETEPL